MKTIKLTENGGFKFDQYNLKFLQEGLLEAIEGTVKAFYNANGDNFIISGGNAVYDAPLQKVIVNPGYAMVNGQICALLLHEITNFDFNFSLVAAVVESNTSTLFDNTVINEHQTLTATWQGLSASTNSQTGPQVAQIINSMPRMIDKTKELLVDSEWSGVVFDAAVADTGSSSHWGGGPAKKCKTAAGHVKLAGSCQVPAGYSGTLFHLPVAYRPQKTTYLVVPNTSTDYVKALRISTTGEVSFPSMPNTIVHVCFDGVEFDTLVDATIPPTTG